MRIAIIAGEASGDVLGGSLLTALKNHYPGADFFGIGGEKMQAAGLRSLYPLETLSVMGLVEVLKHLPELLNIRRELFSLFTQDPPDIFIGIDAPDFNLGLERRLKKRGIKTAHYVSPTVWAWREGRTKTIRKSVDCLLSLFPFETEFLRQRNVPATYVGHPAADRIPLEPPFQQAREKLGISAKDQLIAILPGSRGSEIESLASDFISTATLLAQRFPKARFAVPLANQRVADLFHQQLDQQADAPPMLCLDGQADDVLAASDVALMASGTVTLEALLHKCPMVVAYRLNALTYRILKIFRLIKINYMALPNLLADEYLAPEFIQHQVQPELMADAVSELLNNPELHQKRQQQFYEIHQQLQCNSAERAADAIVEVLNS